MLSVRQIESLKPKANQKKTKYLDADGLYLYISKAGRKTWYFVYKFQGKKKELLLGSYDVLKLAEARKKRNTLRAILDQGIDPKNNSSEQSSVDRKITFEEKAVEWASLKLKNGVWNQGSYDDNLCRLRNHLFEPIGTTQISSITQQQVVTVFKNIVAQGYGDLAHRLRQMFKKILRMSLTENLISKDVVRDIEDALYYGEIIMSRPEPVSYPALTDKEDIAKFHIDCLAYTGEALTTMLLELSAHLMLRPSEIRCLKWKAVNFESSQLIIDVKKGRFSRDHLVPLSTQSKGILLDIYKLTGDQEYVFYSVVSKYHTISSNTVNQAIRRLGYDGRMTAHGFRAMITTSIREQLTTYRNDVIEVQLSHLLSSQTRRAYDRAEYLKERRQMMQDWSDYLTNLVSK